MTLVAIGGPSGAGKSTLCQELASRLELDGQVARIPYWRDFHRFLADPSTYAFQNQIQAMHAVCASIDEARATGRRWVLSDNDPVRVHMVHSWLLRRQGLISRTQWGTLCRDYTKRDTGGASIYIVLLTEEATLRCRLHHRNRGEDLARSLGELPVVLSRWRELAARRAMWANGRWVHTIDAGRPIQDVAIEAWRILDCFSRAQKSLESER